MKLLQSGVRFAGIILLVMALGVGCSPSREASTTADQPDVEVDNPSLSLTDYLRRLPGLTVQGSGSSATVMIRGAQSVNSANQPLFVIDGRRAGRSLSQIVTAVDVNDIDYIEVLKGNEASGRYGMQGSAGVILIRTKKN